MIALLSVTFISSVVAPDLSTLQQVGLPHHPSLTPVSPCAEPAAAL
jgi:hypothetical protein